MKRLPKILLFFSLSLFFFLRFVEVFSAIQYEDYRHFQFVGFGNFVSTFLLFWVSCLYKEKVLRWMLAFATVGDFSIGVLNHLYIGILIFLLFHILGIYRHAHSIGLKPFSSFLGFKTKISVIMVFVLALGILYNFLFFYNQPLFYLLVVYMFIIANNIYLALENAFHSEKSTLAIPQFAGLGMVLAGLSDCILLSSITLENNPLQQIPNVLVWVLWYPAVFFLLLSGIEIRKRRLKNLNRPLA